MTDQTEITRLYERYAHIMMEKLLAYSGNYYMAQDITQETFTQLIQNFDSIEYEDVTNWLINTAQKEAAEYPEIRDTKVFQLSELSTMETEESSDNSPEYILFRQQQKKEYADLCERIRIEGTNRNQRWAQAIILSYVENLPQRKVAEQLNIKIGTLYSLLHRARNWVKTKYGSEYELIRKT